MGLYMYQARYMIECGITNEMVVIGWSSEVYNQIKVWNSVIKHIGVSLNLLL